MSSLNKDYLQNISKDFDNLSEVYDDIWTLRVYDKLILNKINRNESVMEVGCGTGRLLSKISNKSKKAIGIDISKNMVEKARENTNAKIINEPVENIGSVISKNSLDVIVAEHVIHHCEDEKDIAKKFKSLLRPKGKVILIDLRDTDMFGENIMKSKYYKFMYYLSVLKCGLMRREFINSVSGLINERRMFNTEAWKNHTENHVEFRFTEIEKSFSEVGFDVETKKLNFIYKFMVGRI